MKDKKRSALPSLLAFALITNICFVSEAKTPAQAQGAQEAKAKVVQLLETSGYKYSKLQDNLWAIDYTGKQMSSFQVLVSSAPDLVVAGVVVVEKARMKPTTEFFYKLLKLSYNYDLVKVSLDRGDDLFVSVELRLKSLDGEEFKAYVKQVAAAADEIYGQIKPMLAGK